MRIFEQDVVLSDYVREFPCLYDKRTPEYHQRDVTRNCWKEVANEAGLENDFVAKKMFENLGKRYNKAKCELRSSKKSGISTKESEEIAGEQSTIAFMRWLDPYIVNRISRKNFAGEDDQDVQSDMENEEDFPEQEGLQKNEEDELLRHNLNDEFGEENTSLSKGTKITPGISKKRKEMSLKEEEQEIKFLKVVTQKLQKEESEGDLLANLIKRKVEKLPRQLRIMRETELYQILLMCEMQAF